MNFLSRLLGKHRQADSDTSKRRTHAHKSSKPSSARAFETRSFQEMDYCDELIQGATLEGKQQGQALQRVSSLLDTNQVNLRQVRQDIKEINQQLVIASHCNDPLIFKSVMADIDDEKQLLNICVNSPSSKVRNKIVEDIDSYNALKFLEKAFRQKDKSSHRAVKSKLDQLKLHQRKAEEQEKAKARFLEDLAEHAQREYNVDYRTKFESLQRKFEKLTHQLNPDELKITEEQFKHCKTKIDHEESSQAKAEDHIADVQESSSANSAPNTELVVSYCRLVNSLLKPTFDLDELLHIQEQLENISSQIHVSSQASDTKASGARESSAKENSASANNASESGDMRSLANEVDKYIFLVKEDQEYCKALAQIDNHTTDAVALQDSIRQVNRAKSLIVRNPAFRNHIGKSALCDLIALKQKQLTDIEQQEEKQNRQIVGLIRKAHFAVKNGRLKQALGIKRSIQDMIDEKQYLPSYLERQWHVLLEELTELSDWHSYASLPKLEELVKKMRALAENPLEPELQASKIKQLQEEWKLVAKGSGGKHQDLWQAFKALADDAYQICERHYLAQEKAREENTRHCASLIEQLNYYIEHYDWENANWHDVEKLLQSARNDWRKHKPIVKSQQKSLTAQFNEKVDHVQAYLNAEYQKNKMEKGRLVSSLESLVNSSNFDQQDKLDNAIAIAIKYQKQWKQIGICRRSDEQALWQSFRKLCDTIFAQRDTQRARHREETDQIIHSAERIIQALASIPKLSGDSFQQKMHEVDDLKSQFESIEGIPEKIQKPLSKKFHSACNDIEKRIKQLQSEAQVEKWQHLFALKKDINTAHFANDEDQLGFIKGKVEAVKGSAQLTNALLSGLNNTARGTSDSKEEHYRLLCIRAEILSEVETPEADKALRMQHQVEQLQKEFGTQLTDPLQLAIDWFQGGAIDPELYDTLVSRFISSWQRSADVNLGPEL